MGPLEQVGTSVFLLVNLWFVRFFSRTRTTAVYTVQAQTQTGSAEIHRQRPGGLVIRCLPAHQVYTPRNNCNIKEKATRCRVTCDTTAVAIVTRAAVGCITGDVYSYQDPSSASTSTR